MVYGGVCTRELHLRSRDDCWAAVIAGWKYHVSKIVSRAVKCAFSAHPASGDVPVPFDQPEGPVPQESPLPRQANYRPFTMGWPRATIRRLLHVVERLTRGARAPDGGETVPPPSLLGCGFGFVLVLVVIVAAIVMYPLGLGSWFSVSSPTSNDLLSVVISPTEGWAVGESGTILHYHGGSWSRASSPTNMYLDSVAMDSPTDGWAVGGGGTIVHYSDMQ